MRALVECSTAAGSYAVHGHIAVRGDCEVLGEVIRTRVPSAARPIALTWLVKASVGKPGPWSENVVVKWPLASASPEADLTTNVPVCVPPTWKVSSVNCKWKMSVKTRSMEAPRGAAGHSASGGMETATSLTTLFSCVGGEAPAGAKPATKMATTAARAAIVSCESFLMTPPVHWHSSAGWCVLSDGRSRRRRCGRSVAARPPRTTPTQAARGARGRRAPSVSSHRSVRDRLPDRKRPRDRSQLFWSAPTAASGRQHPDHVDGASSCTVHLSRNCSAHRVVATRKQPVLARGPRLTVGRPHGWETGRSVIKLAVRSSSTSMSRPMPSPRARPAPSEPSRIR